MQIVVSEMQKTKWKEGKIRMKIIIWKKAERKVNEERQTIRE